MQSIKEILNICLIIAVLLSAGTSYASDSCEQTMEKVAYIESSGLDGAYNLKSSACGRWQVTQVCLDEYNEYNKTNIKLGEMFVRSTCYKVAYWYLSRRIPQMIRYYHLPDTIEGRLICYNAGIGRYVEYTRNHVTLPDETVIYLEKYRTLK